jgi:drug/metabolite transporter (DMT)-like permease
MGAALVLAPLALPVAVTTSPWTHLAPVVIWSILALAIVCTSAAYIVYFHLIASVGPIPALSVTFLVPVFGLLWGALFLHEQITIGTFGGMAIIFAGVLLVMGARMPRAFRRTRAALALAASAESVESGDSIESIGSSR